MMATTQAREVKYTDIINKPDYYRDREDFFSYQVFAVYQDIVDTFVSPHRLHIHMIFNTHPSQSYAGSKMYARVYKPAAQALAYILEPACIFRCGRGRKINVFFLRDRESINELMSYDKYSLRQKHGNMNRK